jgi:hypothetical protein
MILCIINQSAFRLVDAHEVLGVATKICEALEANIVVEIELASLQDTCCLLAFSRVTPLCEASGAEFKMIWFLLGFEARPSQW